MLPVNYSEVYKTPPDYKFPEDSYLAINTDYPNINSRDYAKRPLNHNLRMQEAWECIKVTQRQELQNGNVVICSNKLSGRKWNGSVWGFEKQTILNDKLSANMESSCFKLECPAIISCMEFIDPNILLLALNTGKLQVWSTHSEVRNSKNPYCPFLIGEKCEHMKPITSLTGFQTNDHKAVTGSKDGAIKIWDMGTADLFSRQSYRYAHTDSITGLASSTVNDAIFSTCSLDKSCLLWDDRETRPAIALFVEHNVRFKNISWALESAETSIYLGDEAGNVLTLDIRKPQEIVCHHKYFDRPIRKILPNGHLLAVLADSNCVKISNSSSHDVLYENMDSENFVRDCGWLSFTELLTVGFEGKLRSHKLIL